MESVYEECLCYELSQLGLAFARQVHLPISYKGVKLENGYKMDIVVEERIVLELKTVETLLPIHSAQLLTYLKLSGKQVGLLLNFNEPVLKKGLKRLVNHFQDHEAAPINSAPSALMPESDARLRLFPDPLKTRRLSVSAVNPQPPVKP